MVIRYQVVHLDLILMKMIVSSCLSLLDSDLNSKSGIIIKPSDYPNGCALYLLDIQSFVSGSVMSKSPKGRVKLSVMFSKALSETINIIVYAKLPEIMTQLIKLEMLM